MSALLTPRKHFRSKLRLHSCSVLVLVACAAFLRGNGVIHRTQKVIQVDDNGHVGRPCEVSLAPPYPEPFASYGTSAVTRTSGRGHVAEAKTKPTSDIIDQIKPLPSPSPLSPMSSEFLDSNKSLHFFKKSTMCPAPVITVTRWSTSLITRCISQGSSKKKRTNALLLAYSPMR